MKINSTKLAKRTFLLYYYIGKLINTIKFQSMSLTKYCKYLILQNDELRAALIKENDITDYTLRKWLRDDYKMLTTKANLLLIEKYTKLTESEILEPVEA